MGVRIIGKVVKDKIECTIHEDRKNKRESKCPVKKGTKVARQAAEAAAETARRVMHKIWPGLLSPPADYGFDGADMHHTEL